MSDETEDGDEYTAIRVIESVKAEAEASKREKETWNEFVLRCSENPPEVIEVTIDGSDLTLDDVEASVEDALEDALRDLGIRA